jgi:hypothetical protein
MALPLLLAGPIVRRVEPTLASVWIALRDPATVTLKLWEGHVSAGSGNMLLSSDPPGVRTLRVGEKLHIALAVVKILPTSPRRLEPGRIYSYDLEIKTQTETHSLKSLGLLTTGLVNHRRVEALGFEENKLPSFALPPAQITDLRVLFGSCRRPGNSHPDAMVWIDDLMRDNAAYSYKDPLKRPHQLFLGGDQIYADDVTRGHMHMLIDLGMELIGKDAGHEALEHLPVDNIREKLEIPNPPDAFLGFAHYGPSLKRGEAPDSKFLLRADRAHFPPGRRLLQTVVEAQMTSFDGRSHLFALGEFAAMYLTVWSNACWPHDIVEPDRLRLPSDADLLSPDWPFDRISTYVGAPLGERDQRGTEPELTEQEREFSPFQSKVYQEYGGPPEKKKNGEPLSDEEQRQHFFAHMEEYKKGLEAERDSLTAFESGLAKVRRALANIPTYMIFDDHDFTDDWNLNPTWYDRVYSTSLGVTAARNALVSYALFQDWGNDPLRYEKQDDYRNLLATIAELFPQGQPGPNITAANDLDHLFGFAQRGVTDPVTGEVAAIEPIIKWHYSVPGPKHLAVALDNRTRRSYVSRLGPPGNVEGSLDASRRTAQSEQIPTGPFTDGKEVLLVIAPLQVLGPPVLDELVAPAAFRAFDVIDYAKRLDPRFKFGSRGMPGTNPDAIEAWAFDPLTLEALLARLEPYRNAVLLSGDVHYSASTVMSYFTKGKQDPARFVQFTNSGFKNVMPSYITVVDRSLGIAHKIIRAGIGSERMGWLIKPAGPIVLPPGTSEARVPRALRSKLKQEPTLLPTYGWPEGSTVNPSQRPDWSWRVDPIFDLRPDSDRPAAIRPLELEDPAGVEAALAEADAPNAIDAYQALAGRHQYSFETLRNSRQILFRSNFGVVRFERRVEVLHAIHEMYTVARRPEEAGTEPLKPELFVLHEAALATPGAERPEDGLQPLEPAEGLE